jgi:hypothetical protein
MAAKRADWVEPKVVTSLKDAVDGEELQMDLTEDPYEFGAPPQGDTVYDFKLFLDKDGIKQGLEDQKDPRSVYFQFSLIAKIVEGEYEGTPVYTNVSTRIWRGKNISTMAGLVVRLGYKIPDKLTPKKLATYLEAILKKEPMVKGELDWRGAYAYPDPKDPNKNLYENVYRHYKDFPEDPDNAGCRLHVVSVTNKHNGGMAEVRAQTQISRFFGKGEVPKVGGLVSAPKLVEKAKVAEVPEKPVAPTIVTGKGKAPVSEEEDMQLILSEE